MSPPPTNIDGTDITGATIDGQDVEEITINGQTVFTAEVPVRQNVIDNYELASADPPGVYANSDTIADYYVGDTNTATLSTSNVPEGNRALSVALSSASAIVSFPGDGLNTYPSPGDTIRCLYRFVENVGLPFNGPFINVSGTPGNFSGYVLITRLNNVGGHRIFRLDNGGFNQIAETSGVAQQGWLEYEIQTPSSTNSQIVWEIYAYDETTNTRGSLLKTLTVNDNTHTGAGIGFLSGSDSDPHVAFDGLELV